MFEVLPCDKQSAAYYDVLPSITCPNEVNAYNKQMYTPINICQTSACHQLFDFITTFQ